MAIRCDTCALATAVDCPYLGADTPEAGLQALMDETRARKRHRRKLTVKTKSVAIDGSRSDVYLVQACPLYRRGPLPPIRMEDR